ncbi:hypothetical protein [Microvirga antarctica]|uniref:hypothetical protein n=1 Tax=Microvirga antarctica TaxID=2819233 RepID=UPI001B31079F|nr:hypothetical protein [Microvirga antarctica]
MPPPNPANIVAATDDKAGNEASVTTAPDHAKQPAPFPSSWSDIRVGSVVLATEGRQMEGWFEAVVTAAKPNDLFLVKWREWPDDQPFVRKREHLALLPPTEAAKAAK